VNWWFGCSDGEDCTNFKKLLSDRQILNLEKDHGTSIVYTHFSKGFIDQSGRIDDTVRAQLGKISTMNGWFVPASVILNRFILLKGIKTIHENGRVLIINQTSDTVPGLTIVTNHTNLYLSNSHERKTANKENKIVLGDLPPFGVIVASPTPAEQLFTTVSWTGQLRAVWEWIVRGL
jgi:hypothetical protein